MLRRVIQIPNTSTLVSLTRASPAYRPVAALLGPGPRNMSSQPQIKQVLPAVSKQYDKALEAGDAFFYPSEVHVLPESSTGTRVPWVLRNVPALLQKPTPNAVKPDEESNASAAAEEAKKREENKPAQNKDDVFAPPYVPNLLVKEMDEGVVLLNKFCVVPRHFLMVTKGEPRRHRF